MKKVLLSVTVIAVASASASAQSLEYQWSKLLAGTGGETIQAVVATENNATTKYVAANTSSVATMTWGEESFGLDAYSAMQTPSYLALSGFDNDGNLTWNVVSTDGYANVTYSSSLAATADGGVVLALSCRPDVAGNENLVAFKDNSGNEFVVKNPYSDVACQPYEAVVLKVSDAGDIEWVSSFVADEPWVRDNGSYAAQLFSVNAAVEDGEGNIYVGGHFVDDLTFSKGETSVTISPKNVADWNGDSQKYTSYGDLYIAKFDADGNFVDVLTVNADQSYATAAQIVALAESEGDVYFAGLLTSNGSNFSIGGADVEAKGSLNNIIVGSLNSDLSVAWVNNIEATPFSDGAHTTQLKGLDVYGSNIYVSGLVKGGFNDDNGSEIIATSTKQLEGYVLSVDATAGALKNAAIYGSNITGYFNAFENASENALYVYGYKLAPGKNMLVKYDLSTFEVAQELDIITGGTATAWDAAYDDAAKQLILAARNNGTVAFYGTEATLTATPNATGGKSFDGIVVAYKTSDLSAIDCVEIAPDPDDAPVEYFNLQGIKVTDPAGGLYIRRQGNTTTKVIL